MLSLELLRTEQPQLQVAAVFQVMNMCVTGRPSLGPVMLEAGLLDLMVATLRSVGSPAELLVRHDIPSAHDLRNHWRSARS